MAFENFKNSTYTIEYEDDDDTTWRLERNYNDANVWSLYRLNSPGIDFIYCCTHPGLGIKLDNTSMPTVLRAVHLEMISLLGENQRKQPKILDMTKRLREQMGKVGTLTYELSAVQCRVRTLEDSQHLAWNAANALRKTLINIEDTSHITHLLQMVEHIIMSLNGADEYQYSLPKVIKVKHD